VFGGQFEKLSPAMKARVMRRKPVRIKPNFRVYFGEEVALGPGKAELLRCIHETSSISEAARQMEMSYTRAWSLIQTMNRCFREPVVLTTRGGQERGGASLTGTGKRLVALYQRLEKQCLTASATTQNELTSLLKKKP
jgi:molybdate transport system regulatory protein